MRLLLVPACFLGLGWTMSWVFADQLAVPEDYGEVVTWLRSHGRWGWAVATAVILADALLPVPSTPALFALGIIYGPVLGGVIGGAASVLAGLLGYGAVRALGRGGALMMVGEDELDRTERFYERWGTVAVALGRAIGGPAEWAAMLAGLTEMPFAKVLSALALGGLLSGVVVAFLGSMSVNDPVLAVGLTVALLAVFMLIGRWMSGPED